MKGAPGDAWPESGRLRASWGPAPLNLLGRARKLFQGLGPPEPPRPQYYRVACPEGHILRGQRTEGYQALRCPECGEGIFILPRSPLPEPPAPTTNPARRREAPATAAFDEGPIALSDPPPQPIDVDVEADAEIEWLDPAPEPEPAPPPAAPNPAEVEFP